MTNEDKLQALLMLDNVYYRVYFPPVFASKSVCVCYSTVLQYILICHFMFCKA